MFSLSIARPCACGRGKTTRELQSPARSTRRLAMAAPTTMTTTTSLLRQRQQRRRRQRSSSPPLPLPPRASSSSSSSPPPPPPPPQQQEDIFARDARLWPKERDALSVAIDKAKDTLSDVAVIAARTFNPTTPRVRASPYRKRKGDGDEGASGGELTRLKASKPVVLVLGSGWASHALSKVIDTSLFDVVIVSPTNHFCFTPMLPSAAVGTVEFRSVLEPVRVSNPTVTYLEAECDEVDLERKVARCTAASILTTGATGEAGAGGVDGGELPLLPPALSSSSPSSSSSSSSSSSPSLPRFEIAYDVIVFALGEQSATFGVPGVREHGFFLKTINDARRLRTRIGLLFEAASLPSTTEAERERLLSFVVVGGGPTGVEFAGTLEDYIRGDLARKFPALKPTVTLLQSDKTVLSVFSKSLQERALAALRSGGIDVKLGVRVMEVLEGEVVYVEKSDPTSTPKRIPSGLTLWSAGNSSRPLVRDLVQRLDSQVPYSKRNPVVAKIAVDPYCRVIGARDALAIGDCAVMTGRRLPATAQVAGQQGAYVARLLNRGYRIGRGGIGPGEGKGGGDESSPSPSSPPAAPAVADVARSWCAALESMDAPAGTTTTTGDDEEEGEGEGKGKGKGGTRAGRAVARSIWTQLLAGDARGNSDELLREARTAAGLQSVDGSSSSSSSSPSSPSPSPPKPFEFLSLGILAYVGSDKGVSDVAVPGLGDTIKVSGYLSFLLWRSVYITKQVSTRNRVLILLNWTMTRIFGRDLSLF